MFIQEIMNNLDERIKEAIDYIKILDLDNIPLGRYDVDDSMYYFVQEYETKNEQECKLESHKKYVDIQYIISGEERFKVASIENLIVAEDYDQDRDVMFWNSSEAMCSFVLTSGGYAVFYPNNAHKPGMFDETKSIVRKLVVKVRV